MPATANAPTGRVKLKNVRLSFAHLFKKVASVEGGPEKFRANFLIDPSTPEGKANIKAIKAAIAAVEEERFGRTGVTYKEGRCSFVRGDDCVSSKTGEPYEGYEGMFVVKANNDRRVPIVDRDRTPLTEEDGRPYSGCYVNAVVDFYAIKDKNKGGLGLFASLQGVQFTKDGEAFGAAPPKVEDMFEAEEFADDEDEELV